MRVSILSAVFNEAAHINEMMASVQQQTMQDWELLFVDDASTDETVELIRAAARTDHRIKLVAGGAKVGKVAAFNKAYAAATGDVIVLLAGDDRLPADSLACRCDAIAQVDAGKAAVAFFKLRMFSLDKKYDGLVVPRGGSASKSGGTITMNQLAAMNAFPIPEHLSGEDLWLRYAAVGAADTVIEQTNVVLEYRIHPGNSNPRARPFHEMSATMHRKHAAYPALLDHAPERSIKPADRAYLAELCKAEGFRYAGDPLRILTGCRLPLGDRLAFASMSNEALWRLRSRFFKLFSGRRGG